MNFHLHVTVDFRNPLEVVVKDERRKVHSLLVFVVTIEGKDTQLVTTFTINEGETKQVEIHGVDQSGLDMGVVSAPFVSSDTSVLTVVDNGNGTGTVTAVGAAGSTAIITADDGAGHTGEADGTVSAPSPVLTSLEVRII